MSFIHFLIGLFFFSVERSLHVVDISPFVRCVVCKYLLLVLYLSSHSLYRVPCRPKVLNFDEAQLIIFLTDYTFGIMSKTMLSHRSKKFQLFSYNSFLVLHFIFKSIIY